MGRLSYTEFVEWIEYLALVNRRNEKRDLYLAQIAAEVRRGYVKHPGKVKAEDFLLGEKPKQERSADSKKMWFAALGIDPKKN